MRLGNNALHNISIIRPDEIKRKRLSSYDKKGGNRDHLVIKSGETAIIGEVEGAGCITHVWCTCRCTTRHYLRNAILRMYWDGESEENPSVEVPLGDFFGMGHAKRKNFVSLPLQMSPHNGAGFNCWWPMPFSKGFKITLENDNPKEFIFYYYIDYEINEGELEHDGKHGRFHAQWRRENPTKAKKWDSETGKEFKKRKPGNFNFTGGNNTNPLEFNYRILEAKGKGHYVGCNLNIDNMTFFPYINWPGEGDDMIFIDDDIKKGVPTLHGTGTEDYVNQAWGQRQTCSAPYHGTILSGGFNFWGKITYYRYHIKDPIYFNNEILVSIEHGHDNHRSDDWSSTAYWYQVEPHDHSLFPKLLDRKGRKPNSHKVHMIRKTIVIATVISIGAFLIYWLFLRHFLL